MVKPDITGTPFGVYIHWPFCLAKCPYCDFNVFVPEQKVDEAAYVSSIRQELERFRSLTGSRQVHSIFFGGGTPSLMHPNSVEAIIGAIGEIWSLADDCEISLEANPTSADAERFQNFAKAGVNRLSVGVQSFDDDALQFLGRKHSAAEAKAAVEMARAQFPNLSLDLIYALPDQQERELEKQIETALEFEPDHASFYQLTIEEGTRFEASVRRREFAPMPNDDQADLFLLLREKMAAFGLPSYEVSNFAKPGAACQHNLLYWRNHDWVGVGPGAHGRFTHIESGKRLVSRQHRVPKLWHQSVSQKGNGDSEQVSLGEAEVLEEWVMMGLRLTEGLSLVEITDKFAGSALGIVDNNTINAFRTQAWITDDTQRLRLTNEGVLRLNALLPVLLSKVQ